MLKFNRYCGVSWICLSLFLCSALSAQQLPAAMKLESVEAQGSTVFSVQEIARMGGLTSGQSITLADLEKASQTLSNWGYFSSVAFAYKYRGTNLTLTFQIEDEKKLLNCLFDNFTQLTDQEIIAAVQREYPSFKGRVPAEGTANQYLQRTIEKLLSEKGHPAKVSFAPILGVGQMVFSQDSGTPLCAIRIEGADRQTEAELVAASANLQREPFSRVKTNMHFETVLMPLVRRRGYWRFQLLEAVPVNESATCSNAITLLVRVKDGAVYSWAKAVWLGNRQQLSSTLDRLLGMQAGEIANLEKIQTGLSRVSGFYWNSGYLDVSVKPDPEIDDQDLGLNYRVQVEEGEQYRMGEFLCGANNERGRCDSLRKNWKLKTNEPFSGSYFDEFENTLFAQWEKQSAPLGMSLKLQLQKDTARKLANIVVVNAR